MAVVLGWIGLSAWLSITTPGWPEAYGSTCHGRACFFEELWYSPGLLNGGPREYALFVCLWSLPAIVAGIIIWAFVTKRGIFAKSDSE